MAWTSLTVFPRLRVIGGGALNASDKIFQDNSLGGKYNITGFYAHTFGTFYQSCGNCLNQAKRNATIQNSIALFGTRLGIVSYLQFLNQNKSTFIDISSQISPNYGDEIRIKDTQYINITQLVTKEIGNNVQTVSNFSSIWWATETNDQQVPIHMGSGPDVKYAIYNLTADSITEWDGKIKNQYVPKDPYPWVAKAWPQGYA